MREIHYDNYEPEPDAKKRQEIVSKVQSEMVKAMVDGVDMNIICYSNIAMMRTKKWVKGLPKGYKGKVKISKHPDKFNMFETRGAKI